MKNLRKTETKQQPHILAIALIVLFVWLSWLTVFVIVVNSQLKLAALANGQTMLNQIYATYKITFCYENSIKPCDDIALKEYNDAHPDAEQFNLTRPHF